MDLAGKTAVITGGASGIGLATAREFLSRGANVVLGDIEEETLALAVEGLGGRAMGLVSDVSREEDVIALRELALESFGAVHVVFNNAGVGSGPTIGTPRAVWDWVMGTNLYGVVNGLNAFVPHFLNQNEGWVLNTASLAGLWGVPGMGAYGASKAAVVSVSESLFHELAQHRSRVGVSVLCPGFVNTRIFESERNMPDELRDGATTPAARSTHEMNERLVKEGMAPDAVARLVADAVEQERFWIFTTEKVVFRTTELRLAWMRGAPAFTMNVERS